MNIELESAVLSLPREQRARLALLLIESLHEDPSHERAWAEEIRRRVESLRRGDKELLPAADVMAEARRLQQGL